MNLINDVSLLLREARITGYTLHHSISTAFRKGKTTGTESKLVLARGGGGGAVGHSEAGGRAWRRRNRLLPQQQPHDCMCLSGFTVLCTGMGEFHICKLYFNTKWGEVIEE